MTVSLKRLDARPTRTARLQRLVLAFHKIKTAVLYRPMFKSIGPKSRIVNPILLINTEFAEIGYGVIIRDGARIECVRTTDRPAPELSIGDHTAIEQNVHIICRTRVSIGKYVTITGNCAIVDVHHPYDAIETQARTGQLIDPIDRPVEIGDYTFIGMHSIILPGVKIGKRCFIGAGSVVNKDIPDYTVAAGNPARILRRYDPDTKQWIRSY